MPAEAAPPPSACIDVGSNTTRLLVAECRDGRLRELMTQRAFTRIGRSLRKSGRVPDDKIAETAQVVATQARLAREAGAGRVVVVATAAIRKAANRDELVAAVEREADVEVEVLSEAAEARLSFVGATKTLGARVDGPVAVVDVGGGSTEVAVGTVAGGVSWFVSFDIGSGHVADGWLVSDPPSAAEVAAAREEVARVLDPLRPPPVGRAVAVGGSATSLRRLVGVELSHEALQRSLDLLGRTPRQELAVRFELDPERVRLLPGGVMILDAVVDRLGRPLTIGNGGLREGVLLELAAGAWEENP